MGKVSKGSTYNNNNNVESDHEIAHCITPHTNPHPFNILNIDIPVYYHLVKLQIDEMRRRQHHGNSYCTIEELAASVRAVQLGSNLYGDNNDNNSSNSSVNAEPVQPRSTTHSGNNSNVSSPNKNKPAENSKYHKANKSGKGSRKQRITEERQTVLESLERTKNAIVYWATVGEVSVFDL